MTETHDAHDASEAPFGRVAVIGLGLMGGSLGLALRAGGLASAVIGYDAAPGVAERAQQRGALDLVAASAAEAAHATDLVVIATPTLAAELTLRAIAAHLAPDVVVTDLCSVKAPLVVLAAQALAHPQRFVGGHPMAGLERAGIEAATADLYRGARWALTPTPQTAPDALRRVRALVTALGAEPLELDAEAHDAAVAGVSHLPMLLAAALTETLAEADDWPTMARLAAGGYRDTTRVAAGDPVMWRDITLANRAELLARLDAFTATLARLRTLIARGDAAEIEAALRAAQQARLAWQATHSSPGARLTRRLTRHTQACYKSSKSCAAALKRRRSNARLRNGGTDMARRTGGSKMGDRMRSLLTLSTLAGIPSSLATIRKFVSAIDWREAQEEIAGELDRKIAIVGMPNSGKSTLFNTLQGQYLSFVSPEAGATTDFVRGAFGPFALIDTPGHLPDMQRQAIDEASATLYLIDATEGVRQRDAEIIQQLRDGDKPFVVALNKTDLMPGDVDELAARVAARLHVTDVTPISAQTGENIAEELIPAIINTSPEAALTLGRLLPQYRRRAANKLVRSATLVSLAAGLQPIPLVDIPILLSNQIRMTLRIAAVYGEPVTAQHLREILTTVAGGLILRYLAEEAAKAVPVGGDLVSGAIAAGGTYALGQVAIEYFENGKHLTRKQINDMFNRYYRRYREENMPDEAEGAALLPPAAEAVTAEPIAPLRPEGVTIEPLEDAGSHF